MIIIRIYGGLGNQLFQYAFGRNLSLLFNEKLYLDISLFNKISRKFDLDKFNIEELNIAPDALTKKYNFVENYRINKLLNQFLCNSYFQEDKPNTFNENVFISSNKKIYYSGHFCSEKYFVKIRNILLPELVPNGISSKCADILKSINNSNSVSIHIRKTDFLQKKNKSIFEICDEKYYANAMDLFNAQLSDITYFVFSDDFKWVNEHIKFDRPYILVDFNNEAYEDLFLMSKCKHNITANSTFSWWGAWLNSNPDKKIITPSKWFKQKDNLDIIPIDWIKICNT
jgi:hypothetical protein